MRHPIHAVLLLTLIAASACSRDDAPSAPRRITPGGPSRVVFATLHDEIVATIPNLFGTGLVTQTESRWDAVEAQVSLGNAAAAQKMLSALTSWVLDKTTPDDRAEASRLIRLMALYVYNGPTTPVPPATGEGLQAAVGIVEPNTSLTLTTFHADGSVGDAGVQFEPGTVAQTTIVTVTEVIGAFTQNCSGPLDTRYCQQPKFFHIDLFPKELLLKKARAQLCHVSSTDPVRPPVGDHDALRLAHELPSSPAFYTPGSTIVDGIEILPWVASINILTANRACHASYAALDVSPSTYFARVLGPQSPVGRLASTIGGLLSPKPAYAVDLGGGGEFLFESVFGLVNPNNRPDLAVQGFATTALFVTPGYSLTVPGFNIANTGTATSPGYSAQLYLSTDNVITTSDQPLGAAVPGASLVPGQSRAIAATTVPIPLQAATGSYFVGVIVTQSAGALTELSATNNVANVALNVVPELYGEAFDPAGDASVPPAPSLPADVVFASARARNGNLELVTRFAAGTRTPEMRVQFGLDTDQNAATGHPGVSANGILDAGVIGNEFIVAIAQAQTGGLTVVSRYIGPPINTFAFVGSFATTFVGDEMRTTIPLSALGNDNGLLNFKAISSDLIPTGGTTSILDVLPNVGLPAVSTGPLGGPILTVNAASPLAPPRAKAASVGETSLLNAPPIGSKE